LSIASFSQQQAMGGTNAILGRAAKADRNMQTARDGKPFGLGGVGASKVSAAVQQPVGVIAPVTRLSGDCREKT
jgi:hypothetical protein